MTKIEELRDKLNGLIGDVVRQMPPNAYGNPDDTIPPVIASLISAAHAEGVAEGAGQERERILESAVVTEVTLDRDEVGYYVPVSALKGSKK